MGGRNQPLRRWAVLCVEAVVFGTWHDGDDRRHSFTDWKLNQAARVSGSLFTLRTARTRIRSRWSLLAAEREPHIDTPSQDDDRSHVSDEAVVQTQDRNSEKSNLVIGVH